MTTLSTHVLDTVDGRPARGVSLLLEQRSTPTSWQPAGKGVTDEDGRARDFSTAELTPGVYRLSFDADAYQAALGRDSFYPEVSVTFRVDGSSPHLHVPLLLSPFGYSTYRGS